MTRSHQDIRLALTLTQLLGRRIRENGKKYLNLSLAIAVVTWGIIGNNGRIWAQWVNTTK
ncbi:hypothetical protein NON20_12445 [Synechocystis sp. B12]|uniref:hypothetical protein n=1 Tax=unclassified Synechocystis TaxID=2640012 RepID=UPI00059E5166|nr:MULTISPECIES: hypothetical protein [unclassified Synechocystis]WLT36900.1 hypothetical protein NON20_12445 [Synechocystis sp. B12]ALJ67311.1 hypothetical protein AOY38_05345 [Synechocystis sp. PCC 6803]MBD2617653.1 hypothetical protein [Synechocystis sp. FACHB-898]MBD2639012.1 hypothetical protein [Synechocystis sp. FACHB-908]MBD2660259.1 hypothetical protein [Synechocystis sp. FACHB-929]